MKTNYMLMLFNNNSKNLKFFFCITAIIFFLCFFTLVGCKKDWLDAKQDKSLLIPSALQDYQSILDNTNLINSANPIIGEMSADNYYTLSSSWQTLPTPTEKNAYIWSSDIYQGTAVPDWNNPYKQVFAANVVIEGISKIERNVTNGLTRDNIIGSAFFYRANAFYNLAQEFCKSYDQATANTDLGIPLRLTVDINKKSVRSTIQQTYDQIIDDLIKSLPLLPTTPLYKTRPSKPAAYALLARTFLIMQNFDKALAYSDSSLQAYGNLLDYNNVNPNPSTIYPFYLPSSLDNSETIFYSTLSLYTILLPLAPNFIIDSTLYQSYDANDLRRSIFFRSISGKITFRGSYTGSLSLFGGIATDEVYLIRAECYARKGNTVAAMNDLNTLLQKRYKSNSFAPLTATNAIDALTKILSERRKELIFRGLRWADLRRLNKETQFAVTLTRIVNGQTYTLAPNEPKYTLPIPIQEIQTSGIEQNPR